MQVLRRTLTCLRWPIFIGALTSCATSAKYEKILASWTGHSETELLDSWGPPDSIYESNDTKYLTYIRGNTTLFPDTAPSYQNTIAGNTIYTNQIGGMSPFVVSRHCKTTFAARDGIIRSWRWEGNACKA
jgi:hypothetical protein